MSVFIIVNMQDIVQISSDDCKSPAINACCAEKMIKGSQLLILLKLPQSLWENRKRKILENSFILALNALKE